jgi:hypothetical protein
MLLAPTGGWKRQCAIIGVCIGVTAGMALAAPKPRIDGAEPQNISVHVRALAGFDKTNESRRRFGKLVWRGGVVMTSPAKVFGGWSGLTMSPDGKSVFAVSDGGTWMRAQILYKGHRIAGIHKAIMGPLKALSGAPLSRLRDRDAEGVTLLSGDLNRGTVLIAFEQNDRIGVFPISKAGPSKPQRYLTLPARLKQRRGKDGLEAVTVLKAGPNKGAILTFLEKSNKGGRERSGWLIKKGKATELTIADVGGFEITDATSLANGDVLLLERRFRWSEGVKMRLRLIDANDLKAGAQITGEILLAADMNQQIDNMEGVSAHQNKKGETIITLISDDNFNRLLQRTVLLQFALKPPKRAKSTAQTARGGAPGN